MNVPNTVIVIPTYNEVDSIEPLVNRLRATGIKGIGFVVIDDGSSDGTCSKLQKMASDSTDYFKIIQRDRKMGIGSAYVEGFIAALQSEAQYIVQMDADLSHPPERVKNLVKGLVHADVVSGSRYVDGGMMDSRCGFSRILTSKFGNYFIRKLLGLNIKDATSGFKAYKRFVVETINLREFRIKGFGFQVEMAYKCSRRGHTIVEIPYVFEKRNAGRSKFSAGIIFEALVKLVLLRIRG